MTQNVCSVKEFSRCKGQAMIIWKNYTIQSESYMIHSFKGGGLSFSSKPYLWKTKPLTKPIIAKHIKPAPHEKVYPFHRPYSLHRGLFCRNGQRTNIAFWP
jgi:hypothetical protein